MKKTLYIILALITLGSCTRESVPNAQQEEMRFTVTWGDDDLTKTQIDPTDITKVLWSPDEYFKFYSGTMGGVFYSMNAVPARTAEVRGGMAPLDGTSGVTTNTYWAIYPYQYAGSMSPDQSSVTVTIPTTLTGAEESFAKNMAVAVARSDNGYKQLTFYNVCGGIRFTVEEPGIKVVQFASVDQEPLSGEVTVQMVNGLPKVTKVNTSIPYVNVTAPDSTFVPGHHYYAMMLPTQTLTSGLNINCIKAGTSDMHVVASTKGKAVQRARIGMLDNIDHGLWNATPVTPTAVDLGGSVLWSNVNLGAASPEAFGNYYAWGETDIKDEYTWDNYKWGTMDALTKYCRDSQYGTVDDKTTLDSEDDAATAAWGDGWRIPSYSDWSFLINNCTWTKTFVSGIPVYKITSKMAGYTDKYILLPVTGAWEAYMSAMKDDGYIENYNANEAFYHQNAIDYNMNYYSYSFRVPENMNSNYPNSIQTQHMRYLPASIRPVKSRNP